MMQDKIELVIDTFLAGDGSNCVAIWKRLAIELETDEDNALAQAGRICINAPSPSQGIIPIVCCFGPALVRRGLVPSFCSTLSDEEVAERIEGYRKENN